MNIGYSCQSWHSGNVYIFYGKNFWLQITLFRHPWQVENKDFVFENWIDWSVFKDFIWHTSKGNRWIFDLWSTVIAGEKRGRLCNVIIKNILCFFEFWHFPITFSWHTENAYLTALRAGFGANQRFLWSTKLTLWRSYPLAAWTFACVY